MATERSFSGREARLLLRRARTGTLATLNRDSGFPYASLVNLGCDVEGRPVILVSALAWHSRNLQADDRASVMVAELPAVGDALTGPRVTVTGRFRPVQDPHLRRRYLGRHPAAERYVDFGDFAFWRLEPELVHAIAGFGRIETLPPDEVFPSHTEIVSIEPDAVKHMNDDHADAANHYATALLGGKPGAWRMAGIDPDGADLVKDADVLRLSFAEPVHTASALRAALAALGRKSGSGVNRSEI